MPYVVATAGHVDHGKSSLIRALTGMEPDRWEEERRRGLTMDLGFAWTTLPSGREVAFVDVPGHEHFLANMLAGIGPAPVVCFVVAVDEGWQEQSSDHRDAVAALGIEHGLIVLTRVDRAPDRVDEVLAQVRAELAGTGLADAPAVTFSALDNAGLDDVRATLDSVLAAAPEPDWNARVRLWVDRAFTISGAGTVVTGTLTAGTVAVGDPLELLGADGQLMAAQVRGLQSRDEPADSLGPVARVALNLRGVSADDVARGDVLLSPGAWPLTQRLGVRRSTGNGLGKAPEHVIVHLGSAAVAARLRALDDDHASLVLDRALPITTGDRLVVRDPSAHRLVGGVVVLDADPPEFVRRGDSARWAERLRSASTSAPAQRAADEVAARGVVDRDLLVRLSLIDANDTETPLGVHAVGSLWIHEPLWEGWQGRLRDAVERVHRENPHAGGLTRKAALDLLGLGSPIANRPALLDALIPAAGLAQLNGRIAIPGSEADLGPAESAIATLEARLSDEPFRAPESDDLAGLKLDSAALAAAERAGRILRLGNRGSGGDGVVLLPTAPVLAMRELARLDQPFTTSAARQALGTTRRVVIPLLEHLDARGWTRRIDGGHREIVRG